MLQIFTKTTTSLVARAKISAHETLFLQLGTLSTAALALITVSNPSPASERLSELSFSDPRFLEASMTEASQPWHINKNPPTTFKRMKKKKTQQKKYGKRFTWTKQSWKKSRRVAGAVTNVWWNFLLTAERTSDSTFGQECR
jgi:hypothetical protein